MHAHPTAEVSLRAARLRPTRARLLILQDLRGRRDHPTADQVIRAVASNDPAPGLATLHQNLALLAEAGVIRRFAGTDGLLHFEAETWLHHHIECPHCGRIEDLEADTWVDELSIPGWDTSNARVTVSAVCSACRPPAV